MGRDMSVLDERRLWVENINNRIRGGRVALLGFGVSNIPLVEMLLPLAEKITVYDLKSVSELGEVARAAEVRGVEFVSGEDYLARIDADVIFRSPGIREDNGGIVRATEKGALLTSETELFLAETPAFTVGITGSDGKTTTTTLVHKFFEESLKGEKCGAYVGGNIGTPLLPLSSEIGGKDVAVLELSSFQLQTMRYPTRVSVLINISENHLNWHKGIDEYVSAKSHVAREGITERFVLNFDNEYTPSVVQGFGGEKIYFSSRAVSADEMLEKREDAYAVIYLEDGRIKLKDRGTEAGEDMISLASIKLPGIHNVENYMAAIGATYKYVDPSVYARVAESFFGVEHRLEPVAKQGNITYYESSIDSTPARTCAALSALECCPIVICGGRNKNTSMVPLARKLCERAAAVVLTGEAMGEIKAAIDECELLPTSELLVFERFDFDDAVRCARDVALSLGGEQTVLLSPACTSFDRFRNFAERGDYFKSIVASFEDDKK